MMERVFFIMLCYTQIPFHGDSCDRAVDLRQNLNKINSLFDGSTAKFICFFKGKPFIFLDPKPMMGLMDRGALFRAIGRFFPISSLLIIALQSIRTCGLRFKPPG